MPAFDVARRWKGRVVLDRSGDKLGSVLDVFYDAENDEPGWVLVGVAGAGEHGNELRVPYDRAFVEAAPGMEPGAAGCGPRRPTPATASPTPGRRSSTWTRRTRRTASRPPSGGFRRGRTA